MEPAMSAEIVRFPDRCRPVRRDITESALVIVLPVVRIEHYADPVEPVKPKVRRKARTRPA
jgi:hypothetical protein